MELFTLLFSSARFSCQDARPTLQFGHLRHFPAFVQRFGLQRSPLPQFTMIPHTPLIYRLSSLMVSPFWILSAAGLQQSGSVSVFHTWAVEIRTAAASVSVTPSMDVISSFLVHPPMSRFRIPLQYHSKLFGTRPPVAFTTPFIAHQQLALKSWKAHGHFQSL